MTTASNHSETVSVRVLWPFMRVVRDFDPEDGLLQEAGLKPVTLADPDARISRMVAGQLIYACQRKTEDAAIGVHAAEHTEPADFGVMEWAVRSCPDLRSALLCTARYTRLQDSNIEAELLEDGDRAIFQIRNVIPSLLRLSNDFQVTVAVMNMARRLGREVPLIEVHLRHSVATDAAEYERVFRAPVRLGRPHNAIVFSRAWLGEPLAPTATVFRAFEERADQLLKQLLKSREDGKSTTDKIRSLLARRIGHDRIGVEDLSGLLHMSPATLRRRLADEGTTYRDIVDGLRRELALQYVAEPGVAIGEIAFLLGFSTQSAFGAAFRRWTGTSPLEHRQELRAALPVKH